MHTCWFSLQFDELMSAILQFVDANVYKKWQLECDQLLEKTVWPKSSTPIQRALPHSFWLLSSFSSWMAILGMGVGEMAETASVKSSDQSERDRDKDRKENTDEHEISNLRN